MKIKILCDSIYLAGGFRKQGAELDVDKSIAEGVVSADKDAKRKPRIEILEKPKRVRGVKNADK